MMTYNVDEFGNVYFVIMENLDKIDKARDRLYKFYVKQIH